MPRSSPRLRVVRKSRSLAALTAAVQVVEGPTDAFRRSSLGTLMSAEDWQADGWSCYDLVGELRYVVGWLAASCSRVRLVGSDIDPDTGLPTGSTEDARVNDIVKSIAGGALGQSQFIKRAVPALMVPGEFWAAIIDTDDRGERWLVVTRDEIRRTATSVEVQTPEGDFHEMNFPTDSMFRVWNPHPRKASDPDSPVRATLDSLHEIVRTTRKIRAADNSRLIGNGLLLLPQEMNIPSVNFPGVPGQAGMEGLAPVQQLQELLWQVAMAAHDDDDSSSNASLIPVIATVPGEQVKNVQHLKFGTDITDIEIKKRSDAINRLAMGLDVSPERLLGIGGTTNHWSAWEITDQDVNLHISPVMETICQAVNDAVFKPVLEREGLDPASFTLWYDATELTTDPDKTNNATAAFTAGAITAEAYVDYLGLDADSVYDYSSIEGWQVWAQDHVSAHPELLPVLAPLLPEPIAELVAEANAVPELLAAPPEGQPPEGQGPDGTAPQQGPPQTENNPPPEEQPVAARIRVTDGRRELVPAERLRNGRGHP